MLPLVGLTAIGLLLAAGKIFLFTDLHTDSQPIPVMVAPPDTPRPQSSPNTQTQRADASEGISVVSSPNQPVRPPQAPDQRVSSGGNLVLDLTQDNGTQDKSGAASPNIDSNGASQGQGSAKEEIREEVIVIQVSPPAPTQPVQPESKPQPQPIPKPAVSRPVAARPAQPAQAQPQTKPEVTVNQPEKTNWMVQVGAFSTPSAAQSVLKQLTQAGHTAVVVPSRTLHRVLVQAGPAKQDALNLATRLGQTGFPGAFVVPPRP
jgi:cell division protein FtsN